jgi:hypothetical protein
MQRRVLIYCTISALFYGNLRYVNTRFGLPKIVLKIIVGEIERDSNNFPARWQSGCLRDSFV